MLVSFDVFFLQSSFFPHEPLRSRAYNAAAACICRSCMSLERDERPTSLRHAQITVALTTTMSTNATTVGRRMAMRVLFEDELLDGLDSC